MPPSRPAQDVGGAASSRLSPRRNPVRLAIEHAVFGAAPVALTLWVVLAVWAHDGRGEDFQFQYWLAGSRVLHGVSPWAAVNAPVDPALAFPYPALTALFFVPFALIPRGISGDVFSVACLAAPLVSLWLLSVRDWRLYGYVLLLAPVLAGWQTANLTLLLGLGIALQWKYRDHPLLAGAVAVVLISLKPFLWPLGLWLLVTRRWSAAAYGLGLGLVLNVASWAIVGLGQIHLFLRVVGSVTHTFSRWGYGMASSFMNLGLPNGLATALAVCVSLALIGVCFALARDRTNSSSFVLVIGLALCASPIVWLHYFALLIIPLAIKSPRFGPLWLIPLLFWVCPLTKPAPWQTALALVAFSGTIGALVLWDGLRRPASAGPIPSSKPNPLMVEGAA